MAVVRMAPEMSMQAWRWILASLRMIPTEPLAFDAALRGNPDARCVEHRGEEHLVVEGAYVLRFEAVLRSGQPRELLNPLRSLG